MGSLLFCQLPFVRRKTPNCQQSGSCLYSKLGAGGKINKAPAVNCSPAKKKEKAEEGGRAAVGCRCGGERSRAGVLQSRSCPRPLSSPPAAPILPSSCPHPAPSLILPSSCNPAFILHPCPHPPSCLHPPPCSHPALILPPCTDPAALTHRRAGEILSPQQTVSCLPRGVKPLFPS